MRDQTKSNEERIAAAGKIRDIEQRILTMRENDLKKALGEELKLAAEQNGVGEEYLRIIVSQYHLYEDRQQSANTLIDLEKELSAAEEQARIDTELGNKAINERNQARIESAGAAISEFREANNEMIRFGDTFITFDQFTDQWKQYVRSSTNSVRK